MGCRKFRKKFGKTASSRVECEEIFFNQPLLIQEDNAHSLIEERFYALGKTNSKRELFVSFTLRNEKVRVISARDMSKKERRVYAKANSKI